MTHDSEDIFMCLRATCRSSLEKCQNFFNKIFVILLICKSSLYIPPTNPSQKTLCYRPKGAMMLFVL